MKREHGDLEIAILYVCECVCVRVYLDMCLHVCVCVCVCVWYKCLCICVCVCMCMLYCTLVCGASGYHGNRNGPECPRVVVKRSMKRLATDIFRLVEVQNHFRTTLAV